MVVKLGTLVMSQISKQILFLWARNQQQFEATLFLSNHLYIIFITVNVFFKEVIENFWENGKNVYFASFFYVKINIRLKVAVV